MSCLWSVESDTDTISIIGSKPNRSCCNVPACCIEERFWSLFAPELGGDRNQAGIPTGILIVSVTDGAAGSPNRAGAATGRRRGDQHLPAGTIEPETGEEAARRELLEETGFRCSSLERVAEGLTYRPGVTDDRNIVVIARGVVSGAGPTDVTEDGAVRHLRTFGNPGEGEQLKVWEVPLARIHEWLAQQRKLGKDIDLRLYAGLSFLR